MISVKRLSANHTKEAHALYLRVAATPHSGVARRPDEIDEAYIEKAVTANECAGLALGAFMGQTLVGELHAFRMQPRQFAHVLTDLTVAVCPDQQGQGIGSRLFAALFEAVPTLVPPVTRIELVARSGNASAIRLYERLGFQVEGRFQSRVHLTDGTYEDDIPMAWVQNPQS